MTQVKTRPPGFVVSCSRPDAMPQSYVRYLINGLRETFDMPGVPIRLSLRTSDNPFAGRAKRRNKKKARSDPGFLLSSAAASGLP